MRQAPPADLDALLRRHLPKDTDPDITRRVVDQWKVALATATSVLVRRVDSYGPKLQASWLDDEGRAVASLARPLPSQRSLRAFVLDWERYMRIRGAEPSVTWDEAPESGPNGASTG